MYRSVGSFNTAGEYPWNVVYADMHARVALRIYSHSTSKNPSASVEADSRVHRMCKLPNFQHHQFSTWWNESRESSADARVSSQPGNLG